MGNINITDNKDYRIERLDRSKLKDLAALYKSVYGAEPAKDYLLKKYNTAYTGVQYIGFIAYYQGDIPAAYYGVMPCFIQYENKMILSAQSGDTMTHPQHRNKGMFVALASITFDLCKAKGIRLIFGFPNQNSYHGLVHKLEWKQTEHLDRFSIPANMLPFESLLRRWRFTKWLYGKYSDWILRKYFLLAPGVPNSCISEGFAGVYRDEQYLEYKTYNFTQVIKIGNGKAWIKIKNGFTIGDLDIADHDFDTIMTAIKKIAKRLGISQILFQASPGTHLHALFSGTYKPILSFPVVFRDLGAGISLDKIKFTFADIDTF